MAVDESRDLCDADYFFMEFIEGETLSTLAADQRGTVRGGTVDIGAWENQSQLFTLTPPAGTTSPNAGDAASFTLGSFTHASAQNIFAVDVDWGDSTSTDFAAARQGQGGARRECHGAGVGAEPVGRGFGSRY